MVQNCFLTYFYLLFILYQLVLWRAFEGRNRVERRGRTEVKWPEGSSLQNARILSIYWANCCSMTLFFLFFFFHVDLLDLNVFRRVFGVIQPLCSTCTVSTWVHLHCQQQRRESSVYLLSLCCYKSCFTIIHCGVTVHATVKMALFDLIYRVLSLIYQLLFVERKYSNIFGNKLFVPCFGILLFVCRRACRC